MILYATVSHRKIRGWDHLTRVEQHNDRKITTPARQAGRPMPVELIDGPGDMVERTKALLTANGVPHKLRKNGVLAYEDVFGASPEYWDLRYPQGWQNVSFAELVQDPVIVACLDHVTGMYGDKLVSVRLHLDEKSPHLHVVSIPLVTREHKQRGRKRKDGVEPEPVMKTTLYASADRGGSGRRLEEEHDKWAAAVAHIEVDGHRLQRGRRGSDLTAEERRDRRLRDDKASRQGEARARTRAAEKAAAAAAEADRKRAAEIRREAEDDRAAMLAEAAEATTAMVEQAKRIKADLEAEAKDRESAAAAAEARAADAERLMKQRLAASEEASRELKRVRRDAQADREAAARDRATAAKAASDAAAAREDAAAQRRAAMADRDAAKNDRAAASEAAQANAMTERQLALVDRAAKDPSLDLALADDARGISMNESAMNASEREAYRASWSSIARSIARRIAKALVQAKEMLANALAELKSHREQVQVERQQLTAQIEKDRRQLNIIKIRLGQQRRAAREFVEAWAAIPDADRSPLVRAVVAKAGLLTQAASLMTTEAAQAKGVSRTNVEEVLASRRDSRGR